MHFNTKNVSHPRDIILLINEFHKLGYEDIMLHSYIKEGLGALRVGIASKNTERKTTGTHSNDFIKSFYIETFSSFPEEEYVYDQQRIKSLANEFIDDYHNYFTVTENKSYTTWFRELIEESKPDGFYVVENQKIIYPYSPSKSFPYPFPLPYYY